MIGGPIRGLEKNQRQTNTHTLRLLDQLGPEGRVGENKTKQKFLTNKNLVTSHISLAVVNTMKYYPGPIEQTQEKTEAALGTVLFIK